MASMEERRDNTTHERELHLEKDKVPKLTSHFEAIAHGSDDKDRPHDKASSEEEGKEASAVHASQFESIAEKVAGLEFAGGLESKEEKHQGIKVKEANQVVDQDQQRPSMEQTAKKSEKPEGDSYSIGKFELQKEETERPSLAEISSYRQAAQQDSINAINAAQERCAKGKESSKHDQIKSEGEESKDRIPSTDYAAQKAAEAKEKALDATKNIAGYVGEKTAAAKDVAVGLAGKVAVDVKDKAVVAGWGVAHFTAEKTVEATKLAADVVKGASGYAGEAAETAKDVVVGTGQKVAEFAEKQAAAAKDAAVSAGVSVADYTARKREEAERSVNSKRGDASNEQTGGGVEGVKEEMKGGGQQRDEGLTGKVQRSVEGCGGRGQQKMGGGVLGAIGETIVEIAQNTKEIVGGRGSPAEATDVKSDHHQSS